MMTIPQTALSIFEICTMMTSYKLSTGAMMTSFYIIGAPLSIVSKVQYELLSSLRTY